jgi:hypothetical protein
MKRPSPSINLDALPMFASDREIAEAIVGKDNAEKWTRERLPTLAQKPGFPPIDPFHGGRPVALVKLFYANYLNLPSDGRGLPDGRDREGEWKKPRRQG